MTNEELAEAKRTVAELTEIVDAVAAVKAARNAVETVLPEDHAGSLTAAIAYDGAQHRLDKLMDVYGQRRRKGSMEHEQ
jgi:hypothetical protein